MVYRQVQKPQIGPTITSSEIQSTQNSAELILFGAVGNGMTDSSAEDGPDAPRYESLKHCAEASQNKGKHLGENSNAHKPDRRGTN